MCCFRCGIYPAHILYSTLYDAKWYIEFFSAYYIFNFLLVTLQVLHLVWTYFLFKVNKGCYWITELFNKKLFNKSDFVKLKYLTSPVLLFKYRPLAFFVSFN